jgi:hypothetical protein
VVGAPSSWGRELTSISEAASKKKRGRTPVLPQPNGTPDDLHIALFKSCWPDIKTTRGLQNRYYQGVGLNCLGSDKSDEFLWLFDPKTNIVRSGILAELGRIAVAAGYYGSGEIGAKAIHTVQCFAAAICEQKPSTKQAIVRLRRWRMKVASKRDDWDDWRASKRDDNVLLKRLADVIDQYRAAHPEITNGRLLDIVNELYCVLGGP